MILQENARKPEHTPEILHIPLAIESVPFYTMAGFLGIPRKRSTFYRKHKFLESAEHIFIYNRPIRRYLSDLNHVRVAKGVKD